MDVRIQTHGTYKNRLMNENGLMYPNLTKKCIEWLLTKENDLKNYSIYEYGAEVSYAWWKTMCKEYDAVTDNREASIVIECKHATDQDSYKNDILKNKQQYDVIVINGKWRDECCLPAMQSIKKGGYIVINNYHQPQTIFSPSNWRRTDKLLKDYPIVMFHGNEIEKDNRTAIWQIV